MTMNPYAVFFLNTGRCGSQFFASKLAQYYDDIARIEYVGRDKYSTEFQRQHDPNLEHYHPRHYFSMLNGTENVEISAILREHFDSIDETLQTKHYIETGWPTYGILPYLIDRFKGRIKVVHLFRHPAKVAASLATHNVYSRGEWSNRMSITPEECGVKQDYLGGDQWSKMDEFCKCLFWWTEINRFALDLNKKNTTTPWHSLRFEEVFDCEVNDALRRLVEFLGFPVRDAFVTSTQEKVDRYQWVKDFQFDVNQIKNYDETVRVMVELDYALDEISNREIRKRYQISNRNKDVFPNSPGN